MTMFLRLLVEAVLYYIACKVAARRDDAPGFIRVLIVVLLLALLSGGTSYFSGAEWTGFTLNLVISFFILWIGLGIGFIRTIIAVLLVNLLRYVLIRVFAGDPIATPWT